jgi:hypothetical protein
LPPAHAFKTSSRRIIVLSRAVHLNKDGPTLEETMRGTKCIAIAGLLTLAALGTAQAQTASGRHELLRDQRRVRQGRRSRRPGGRRPALAGLSPRQPAFAARSGAPISRLKAQAAQTAVNAKDRIGRGPWQNAKGTAIAKDVADLHGPNNNLTKQTALTEKGELVKGRGDQPNQHDILTGSQPDGTAFAGNQDMTCGNWTRSGTEGAAMTGHHDRMGLDESPPAKSWNSSHATPRRVQPGCPAGHGRRGPVLLLCGQLIRRRNRRPAS